MAESDEHKDRAQGRGQNRGRGRSGENDRDRGARRGRGGGRHDRDGDRRGPRDDRERERGGDRSGGKRWDDRKGGRGRAEDHRGERSRDERRGDRRGSDRRGRGHGPARTGSSQPRDSRGGSGRRRPDRPKAPQIPEGITGRELPGELRSQLRSLSKESAEAVAKHLVAASMLIEADPEAAHEHAQAAVRRASRVGAVREAAGIVAYQTDRFAEAARELRTHRRISGSHDNLPLIADSERGRGKPDKALELFAEADEETLGSDIFTELLMVAAGAHVDQGDVPSARALLETRSFTGNANGTLVRLLSVYSDVIRLEGDADLADRYEELARRTAKATGTVFGDEEPDPNADVEILTLEETEPVDQETPQDHLGMQPRDGDKASEPQDESGEPASAAQSAGIEADADVSTAAVDGEFDAETVAELDEILTAADAGTDAPAAAGTPSDGQAATEPSQEPGDADRPAGADEPEPRTSRTSGGRSPGSGTAPAAGRSTDTDAPDEPEELTEPLFDL